MCHARIEPLLPFSATLYSYLHSLILFYWTVTHFLPQRDGFREIHSTPNTKSSHLYNILLIFLYNNIIRYILLKNHQSGSRTVLCELQLVLLSHNCWFFLSDGYLWVASNHFSEKCLLNCFKNLSNDQNWNNAPMTWYCGTGKLRTLWIVSNTIEVVENS